MTILESEDLRMMADAAQRLVAKPEDAGWAAFADLGWFALPIGEAYGGLGAGLADMLVVLRTAGAAALPDPLISTLVVGAALISGAGDDEQKNRLLPSIAEGKLTLAFAHTERDGGQDRSWLTTQAVGSADTWSLTGTKVRILDGPIADTIIVSARIQDGQTALFLVSPDDAMLHAYDAVDGRPMADIELAGCPAKRLGTADASAMIDAALDRACVATCLDACGAMLAANAITLDYIKTRKQFGVAIGSFQVLQHRMADMTIAATQALAVSAAAAAAIDRNDPDSGRRASAAKVTVNRAAELVGEQAIQLHGGIGVTEEYLLGRFFKRLLLARSMYGDTDWHLARLQG